MKRRRKAEDAELAAEPGLNFEADVEIDPDALDVEWLRQANLVYQYNKATEEAQKAVDEAQLEASVVEAELDEDVRKNPEGYGIEGKLTEAIVKNTIRQAEKYQVARKMLIQAQYELGMAQAASKAIYTKRAALENLVKLALGNYFATPEEPRNLKEEAVKAKSRNYRVRAHLNRSRSARNS